MLSILPRHFDLIPYVQKYYMLYSNLLNIMGSLLLGHIVPTLFDQRSFLPLYQYFPVSSAKIIVNFRCRKKVMKNMGYSVVSVDKVFRGV